jgi:hypothetical protein
MPAKIILPQPGSRGNNYSTSTKNKNEVQPPQNNDHSLYTSTWRKRGEQVRAALMKQDESNGAQTFILSSSCPIQRYYEVADKVWLMFTLLLSLVFMQRIPPTLSLQSLNVCFLKLLLSFCSILLTTKGVGSIFTPPNRYP